ncbi:hypothetical protein RQP54_18860 [Curvibacter sp. APW13]|uniref:hypothetical protein n=1 Tax=Curvibacter sp. APW13 TaxID=3077236 RepID=UPI0028DF7B5B|nr:hypothetical protein [Curvibacter sp. APW13]MDT8992943.1 hypothetical protein [Curvibacter sp. APW13]
MSTLVYIDSNVLKFAATELRRFKPREIQLQWGPLSIQTVVHDNVTINPNDHIMNAELRSEADLLPEVAQAGKIGTLNFVQTAEGLYETWGLPNLDSEAGKFYGAPIRVLADIPFAYARVMGGGSINGAEEQMRFLTGIRNARFQELQRACGAYQGATKPPNRNQLLDAFHLWSAEVATCSFLLTLDFKLQRVFAKSKIASSVRIVRPSELLQEMSLLSDEGRHVGYPTPSCGVE